MANEVVDEFVGDLEDAAGRVSRDGIDQLDVITAGLSSKIEKVRSDLAQLNGGRSEEPVTFTAERSRLEDVARRLLDLGMDTAGNCGAELTQIREQLRIAEAGTSIIDQLEVP